MGSRYMVSGVQLGMIKALITTGDEEEAQNVLDTIAQDQHVQNSTELLEHDVQNIRELYTAIKGFICQKK
jgi:thioredoxin-like negative regulator of GroEL